MSKTGELFGTFFKIGAFTFGGGYAMVALLEHEFVEEKRWLTREEFLDMVAIAESTPGPVAVNSATYIGYKLAGVAGAAASTLAVCLPSFAVIYLISLFFDRFLQLTVVANAFKGIQACVIYLILSAGVKMLKNLQRTPFNTAVVAVVLAAMVGCSVLAVKFSSICCILLWIVFPCLKQVLQLSDSDIPYGFAYRLPFLHQALPVCPAYLSSLKHPPVL